MLKRQFISRVAILSHLSAEQVSAAMEAIGYVAAERLIEAGEVRIPGLVSLKVLARSERAARNPKTGKPCMIPPGHMVKARPVCLLSDRVVIKLAQSY